MKSQSVTDEPSFSIQSFCLIDPVKVYSSIVDVVFAIDEQGVFRYVSSNCLELFGYTQQEMTGASFLKFIYPDDIEKTVQIVTERTHDCRTSNFENRYIQKDGTIQPIIWSGRWDANDRLLYCVARDGSEKKEVEHRLHKAQQLARVANYEFDLSKNCYTYTSDTFYELFGLDRNKYPVFTTELFWSLVHPDDVEKVRTNLKLPDHLYTSKLDYRIIRPDGEIVYVHRIREVLRDKSGRHIKTIGTIQDITDRKISELALKQSEERFRSLVQNGNDLLGIIDIQGNYQFVGGNVQEHLGFHAEELIGKNAFALIHPDDAGWVGAQLQEITQRPTLSIGPFRFMNSKGEWRWMETTVSNHLENPAIGGLVVNSRDITERKRKDDELRRLSLIAQESHSPILIASLSNEITWANKAFYQISGFHEEDIVGKPADKIFITEFLNITKQNQIQDNLRKGKTIQFEEQFLNKKGSAYWLDLTIQPVYGENGDTIYFLAIGKDITAKKEAELAKQQIEQRYQTLVQNGSDLIVIIDEEANFTYFSDNAKAILGYAPEEMIGKNAFDFIHPSDTEKVAQEIDTVLHDGANAKGVQHRFKHQNGTWLWLESKGINHQKNNSIGGILVNSRNITDRVMLQNRLNRELHNKQKEITAAVIKAQETERSQLALELHDNVNQILTTVKLYNEMYLTGFVQDKEFLVKSTQYTQDCINEIRSISKRLSAPLLGKISLYDSIQELVNSINLTKRMEINYIPKNIERCNVSEDLHLAVYRIVQEGLNNILKYSQASEAQIEIARHDGELCLKISDNGIGFDIAAKRTGIGITNMKTRAESMNASFELKSSPGKGCQIIICFPFENRP